MKKIIRLTERDLTRIVRRVIRENEGDIEEPYYTKSYGDPLEFYKNGMMQFALSVNLRAPSFCTRRTTVRRGKSSLIGRRK